MTISQFSCTLNLDISTISPMVFLEILCAFLHFFGASFLLLFIWTFCSFMCKFYILSIFGDPDFLKTLFFKYTFLYS